MFYQTVNIGFALILVAFLSACSGGGRDLSGAGNYCPEVVNQLIVSVPHQATPIEFEFKPNGEYFTKMENEAEAKEQLKDGKIDLDEYKRITQQKEFFPPGEYVLESSQFLYYQDANPEAVKDVPRSQINDARQIDGTYLSSAFCDGGYDLDTPKFSTEIEGLQSLTLDTSGKVSFTTRQWGFTWDQSKLIKSPMFHEDGNPEKPKWGKTGDSSKYSSPKEVFPVNKAELKVYQLTDKSKFLIIYEQTVDGTATLFLRQEFKRTDLPQKEGEEEERPDDFMGEERS